MATTLTSKGQVTIPKPIREYLGLNTGDVVEFEFAEDGTVRVLARIIHEGTERERRE